MATQTDIAFPIIGFRKNGEVLVCLDAKYMCEVRLEDVDNGEIAGTELTDASGAGWRIASVEVVKARWFSSRYMVAYVLDAAPALSIDELKARVCASMEADPWMWCDTEPPDAEVADPAKLIGKETAKILAARDVGEICAYFGPYWF